MNVLLVTIGGFFGSITRFYLSMLLNKHFIGTWIANMSGSILLGVLTSQHIAHMLPEWLWILIGIGFCGAYTTFSTFGNETLKLILEKKYLLAFSYVFASIVLTILIVYGLLKF